MVASRIVVLGAAAGCWLAGLDAAAADEVAFPPRDAALVAASSPSRGTPVVLHRDASLRVLHVGGPDDGAPPEELPPVEVVGRGSRGGPAAPTGHVSLSTPVGRNGQPSWTTHRRFATTRAYVSAPWQVEFESWWEGKFRKDGTERHRFLEEVSIGLPHRFQFDFYWRIQDETGEETRTSDFQVEGRWALAPWDRIPLNPTVYLEYKFLEGDEPEVWEAKLLLADDIGCRWQWAANLFYEAQTSGDEEIEMGFSTALSYSLFDPCLSIGVEAKYERTTAKGSRDDPEIEFLLGPSIQWRPFRGVHLDLVPLFGLTDDSPDAQVWIVLGFDLWPGSSRSPSLPTSSRAR